MKKITFLVLVLATSLLAQGTRPPIDKLSLMRDVTITNPLGGDRLTWDGSKWVNQPGGLPTQTGQSGKFLSTNGTSALWAMVTAPTWGNITGTLSSQSDLSTALAAKAALTGGTSGHVITANGPTGIQDSGVALSSLAPKASPTFTGTVVLPDSQKLYASGHTLFLDAGARKLFAPDGTSPWVDLTNSLGNGGVFSGYLADVSGNPIVDSNNQRLLKPNGDIIAQWAGVIGLGYPTSGVYPFQSSNDPFTYIYQGTSLVYSGESKSLFGDHLNILSGAISIGDNTGSAGSWDASGNLFAATLSGSGDAITFGGNLYGSTAFGTSLDLSGNSIFASYAPLASPALSGVPTAPTASASTNSTQIATTAYADNAVAVGVTGLLKFQGATNCSANPNYPSAVKGDGYIVSVAGKIGGASGTSVDIGDWYIATANNAGGTEASVGTSWAHLEHNLVGALLASNNLSDLANANTARTNLGLAIGTDVVGFNGALGTPSSGTATNLTGTAASLTAGHVTTNANLTGDVTSVGNATTLANIPAINGANLTALTAANITASTTAGRNILNLANPSAISFVKIAADNTVSTRTPAQVLSDIGAQASGSYAASGANGDITSMTGLTGTVGSATGYKVRDSSAAFDVTLAATSSTTLTAGRAFTLDMGNVAHTLVLGTTAGTITFPNTAADTVAMLGIANTFTAAQTVSFGANKTVTLATNSIVSGTALNIGSATTSDTSELQLSTAGSVRWRFGYDALNAKMFFRNHAGSATIVSLTDDAGAGALVLTSTGLTILNNLTVSGGTITNTTSKWLTGSGSPEGVKTAVVGSLYTRTDGGAGTTLYVKESGSGNIGWIAK